MSDEEDEFANNSFNDDEDEDMFGGGSASRYAIILRWYI
jgi:hypothetical protein